MILEGVTEILFYETAQNGQNGHLEYFVKKVEVQFNDPFKYLILHKVLEPYFVDIIQNMGLMGTFMIPKITAFGKTGIKSASIKNKT